MYCPGPARIVTNTAPKAPAAFRQPAVRAGCAVGGVVGAVLMPLWTRFAFCPGRFAVQLEPWSIPLGEVEQLECPGAALFVIRAQTLAEPGIFLVPSSQAIVDRLRECGMGLELVSSEHE